eukprot:scaffold3917_cov113-Isochrysis_galbana.AAC.5
MSDRGTPPQDTLPKGLVGRGVWVAWVGFRFGENENRGGEVGADEASSTVLSLPFAPPFPRGWLGVTPPHNHPVLLGKRGRDGVSIELASELLSGGELSSSPVGTVSIRRISLPVAAAPYTPSTSISPPATHKEAMRHTALDPSPMLPMPRAAVASVTSSTQVYISTRSNGGTKARQGTPSTPKP